MSKFPLQLPHSAVVVYHPPSHPTDLGLFGKLTGYSHFSCKKNMLRMAEYAPSNADQIVDSHFLRIWGEKVLELMLALHLKSFVFLARSIIVSFYQSPFPLKEQK